MVMSRAELVYWATQLMELSERRPRGIPRGVVIFVERKTDLPVTKGREREIEIERERESERERERKRERGRGLEDYNV